MDTPTPDANLDRDQLIADAVGSLRTVLQLLLLAEGENFEAQALRLSDAVASLLDVAGIAVCMRCTSYRPRPNVDEPHHFDPDTCDNAAEQWHQDNLPVPEISDDDMMGWFATADMLPPLQTAQEREDRATRGLERLMREGPGTTLYFDKPTEAGG